MKKMVRFLCLLLVLAVMIPAGSVAAEEERTVYIPARIAGLRWPALPSYPGLSVRVESVGLYGNVFDPQNPCPIRPAEDADIELRFSGRPDWAGVNWSDGYENLVLDDEGNALTSMTNHALQPGFRANSGCDPVTGKLLWYDLKEEYAFTAGRGPVTVWYSYTGATLMVEYTVQEDYFETGIDGTVTVIRYEPGYYQEDEEGDGYYGFISSVRAAYPAGSGITGVEAKYRNDTKQALYSYSVTYEAGEGQEYRITYSPENALILEDHAGAGTRYYRVGNTGPSVNLEKDYNVPAFADLYLRRLTADEPIYGEYLVDGVLTGISGSGDKLGQWFTPEHGRKLKRDGLRPCTSFMSPRVQ